MINNFHDIIELPSDVLGFLEWSSGVLWINMDSDLYLEWIREKDDRKDYIDEAIYHELYHGLQVATTGYMNYYSSIFLKEILIDHKSKISLINRTSNQFCDWFDHLYDEDLQIGNNARTILEKLDDTSECGVSTREIIEGSAYLWQKSIIKHGLTYIEFKRKLKYAPSTDYTNAFTYLESIVGEDAFTLLHAISFASLCFLEPHTVFPLICDKVKNVKNCDISDVVKIVHTLTKEHHFLGDVKTCFRHVDFDASEYDWINPLHRETIKKVLNTSEKMNVPIFEMMSNPLAWFEDLASYMHRPMIFKNGEIILYGNERITEHSGKKPGVIDDFIPQLYIGVYCFILYIRTGKGPKFLKTLTV